MDKRVTDFRWIKYGLASRVSFRTEVQQLAADFANHLKAYLSLAELCCTSHLFVGLL